MFFAKVALKSPETNRLKMLMLPNRQDFEVFETYQFLEFGHKPQKFFHYFIFYFIFYLTVILKSWPLFFFLIGKK